MTLHFLNDIANDAESTHKKYVIIASLKSETMGVFRYQVYQARLRERMLNCSANLAMSTSVLKALPGKLDIERHSPSNLYLSVTSHINCIAARFLINLVYLTACAFIRSS